MTTSYLSLPNQPDLIELNCLGTIFIIRESSLNRFPNTLLGSLLCFFPKDLSKKVR